MRRLWVAVGSVLAAAGAVAGILSLVEARWANMVATSSDLRVAEHRVTTKADVGQTWINTVSGERKQDSVNAAAVDLLLDNRGDQSALITEIEVIVRSQDELGGCTGAGAMGVTTAYDLRIPHELRSRSVRKPVLYTLDGKSKERVLISIGPEGTRAPGKWGTIYAVDLRLKQDSGEVLTIPDLVLMDPWRQDTATRNVVSNLFDGYRAFGGIEDYRDCTAENMRTLKRAIDRPGTHSPGMVELYDRLRAAGAAGPVDGIWVAELETLPPGERTVERVSRLEAALDAPVLSRDTGAGTVLYHPGVFDGPEQARSWCRKHGQADPSLCKPRYLTPKTE